MAVDQNPARRTYGQCPVCGAPVVVRYRPFCSRRCADLDLGRWLTGAYAAPAEEEDAPNASEAQTDDAVR